MKFVASALAASVLLSSTVATANSEAFAAADTDNSGEISLSEALAAYPRITGDSFEESDTDESGGLNREEFDEAVESGMLDK